MAFFPVRPMPKELKRETSKEVDNNPSIFNARDFNVHHREIIAIEKMLIGDGSTTNNALINLIRDSIQSFYDITNNGKLGSFSGIVASGTKISVPAFIPQTTTSGVLAVGDTTITVVSTADFPDNGFLTKFNSIKTTLSGDPPTPIFTFGENITSQEIIAYTGKTDTTFTGCTRQQQGTIAQSVASDVVATIIAGRASLFLSGSAWASNGNPYHVFVEHDAELEVTAIIIADATALTGFEQAEENFSVTAAGLAIDLTQDDINGNVSHAVLNPDAGLEVFGIDSAGRALSMGIRGREISEIGVGAPLVGAGGIFITGHDPDFHAISSENTTGAKNIIRRAVEYVTNTMPPTSLTMLLITDIENPGVGHLDSRLGLDAAAVGQAWTITVADYGSGAPGVLNLNTVDFNAYDVIVVASNFGGWLRQRELDILNGRSNDLIDYINDGGGLVALCEQGSSTNPVNNVYKFLPFIRVSTGTSYLAVPYNLFVDFIDI
jgi:hypothetical protein